MIRRYANQMYDNIANIICTGFSRHNSVCDPCSAEATFVVVQELLDKDLWEAIYEPSEVERPLLRKESFLQQLCWQAFTAMSSKSEII